MKILVLNAPGASQIDAPLMGPACLVAHLKTQGYTEVVQKDLDLELFYYSLKPETLDKILRIIREGGNGAARSGGGAVRRILARTAGPVLLKRLARSALKERDFIESFRSSTPIDQPFPEEGLFRFKKALNRVMKLMAVYFYPYPTYPRFFSIFEKRLFPKIYYRLGHAIMTWCQHGMKIYRDFYETEILPHLQEADYDLIGISVSFKQQVEPALLLCEALKQSGLRAKIVVGGSFLTTILDSGWTQDDFMEHMDYIIAHEGEEALAALLDHLQGKIPLEDVPNLVHRKDGRMVKNKGTFIKDLDTLETPDFEGLELDRYLERPVRLPIMTSRGCYWGKCTYCSHHFTLGTGRLRVRSPVKLREDIEAFRERYGVNSLWFTDESVHPPTMEGLSKELIKAGIPTRWVGLLRFDACVDRDFLELIHRGGCRVLMFGLESVSQHVQEIINKGILLSHAREILENCKDLGIKVHLFIILGIPGERDEDMRANIDFLLQNTHLYETVQIAPFQLMVDSPMYRRPEKYGIHSIETGSFNDWKSCTRVSFETSKGLDRAKVDHYVNKALSNKILFNKDLWEGHGYRLYREELAGSRDLPGSPVETGVS